MRESRPYGSERGAFSNGRPYRDRTDGHRGFPAANRGISPVNLRGDERHPTAEGNAALKLRRPLPDGALMIVARGDRTGDPPGAALS
jgi:hypothetical protein